ncbi:hypothetical protein ACF1BP_27745 [Streptomyces sp. NPDC014735]|uniref:hypothetical protein n=1 Tax=unclassified Streptomyces TaxID=2593676 RepID=UPI0036F9E668
MNEAAWRAHDLLRAYAARARAAIVEHLAHLEDDQLEFAKGVVANFYNDTPGGARSHLSRLRAPLLVVRCQAWAEAMQRRVVTMRPKARAGPARWDLPRTVSIERALPSCAYTGKLTLAANLFALHAP